MKKLSTLAVLATAMVSIFAVVAPAQAANWHGAPAGGAFTATGPGTTLKVQGKTTSCTSTSASGNLTGSGGGIVNGPVFTSDWVDVMSWTQAFAGCTNAGVNYGWFCRLTKWLAKASGYLGGSTSTQAGSAGAKWQARIEIACRIKPTASPSNNCATVTGTVEAGAVNASLLTAGVGAGNQGSVTILTTGQSLTVTSVGGCIASIGTGSATLGSMTYTVSGSPAATVAAPDIWAN
ncbi:MAG: hypothetical protein JWQ20_270 [Conexibacter sp.]|nr:hypothetical protein [Conexibacter sp.]